MAPRKKVEEKEEDIVKVDLLDVLLDENNTAPIYMTDASGRRLKFDQIAVIPYGEDSLYCILKPISKIEGVADDEAIVFRVEEDDDGEAVLNLEENEEIAIAVFDQYYTLVEEEESKKAESKKKTTKASAAKAAPKSAPKTAAKVPAKSASKTTSKKKTDAK